MNRSFYVIAALFIGIAAAHADSVAESRGAAILAPFKADLKEALLQGLAQGPEEAIGACKLEAPGIAEALSVDGVTLGRSSHRLRNPANAGPEWVTSIMQVYLDDTHDRAPRTVDLPGGKVGYVEPILVQPMCLVCHGDIQDQALAARLADEYPSDQATGFRAGDLRGVFWASFPAAEEADE